MGDEDTSICVPAKYPTTTQRNATLQGEKTVHGFAYTTSVRAHHLGDLHWHWHTEVLLVFSGGLSRCVFTSSFSPPQQAAAAAMAPTCLHRFPRVTLRLRYPPREMQREEEKKRCLS